MVASRILEPVGGPHRESCIESAKPEECRIEEMRPKVGQHAGAAIAPRRIPDIAGRAIAIKHSAEIYPSQRSGLDCLPHTDEVRLEAMIVGCVANCAPRS